MPRLRLLPSLVQRFSEAPLGKTLGEGAYRVAALAAATALHRIPGVDAVYLSGSITQPDRLHPGYSDIDLVLVVDVPTVGHEVELRRKLRRALGRLNAAGALFKHLDNIESADLDLLARWGNAWTLELGDWRPAAGVDRRTAVPEVPRLKRQVELAIAAFRRWQAASSIQLDPQAARPPGLARIGARRTLSDLLSAWLDVPRLCPLETLLGVVDRRAPAGSVLADLVRRPRETVARTDSEVIVDLVTAGLEALELLVGELDAIFTEEWTGFEARRIDAPHASAAAVSDGGFLHHPDRAEGRHGVVVALEKLGARTIAHGFASLYRTLDRDGNDVLYAVTPAQDSGRIAVERLRRLLDERAGDVSLARLPRPVLITPTLFRAAALFDGAPLTGADLAVTADCVAGTRLKPPLRPSDEAWIHLLTGRLALLLYRPRGRGLRAATDLQGALRKLDKDVAFLAPALLAAFRGERVSLERPGSPAGDLDEATLIGRLRDLQGVVRSLVGPHADSRTRTSPDPPRRSR